MPTFHLVIIVPGYHNYNSSNLIVTVADILVDYNYLILGPPLFT